MTPFRPFPLALALALGLAGTSAVAADPVMRVGGEPALAVPRQAVLNKDGKSFVYRRTARGDRRELEALDQVLAQASAMRERDLLLIRVHCPPEKRGEIRHLTEVFRASIVDVGAKSVLVQLTGPEDKIEAFIE